MTKMMKPKSTLKDALDAFEYIFYKYFILIFYLKNSKNLKLFLYPFKLFFLNYVELKWDSF